LANKSSEGTSAKVGQTAAVKQLKATSVMRMR
jgi:hypothetical protein